MCSRIGVIGATGAVGEEALHLLCKRPTQWSKIIAYASGKSAGKTLHISGINYSTDFVIEEFSLAAVIRDCDVVIMAVSGDFSRLYTEELANAGVIVIDNSSAFRMVDNVPLIIPAINKHSIDSHKIIANPNCTTAIAAMVLWPLHKKYKISKLIISTYQAVSGAGKPGIDELNSQLSGSKECRVFAHPIAKNLIPKIDQMTDNGYSKEEMKVTNEMRKIFDDSSILISTTAVRVPTERAHAESMHIEFVNEFDISDVLGILQDAEGVCVVDDPFNESYPMPINASDNYDVFVGRIRNSLIGPNSLECFVCGDQLLRGASLNAVEIAECVFN